MTEEEVEKLATEFLLETLQRKLKLIGLKPSSRHPDEWDVVFETSSAEGLVFDGPTVVIVNERTKSARFF